MKPAPQDDITSAPDPNSLPVKWQASARNAGDLPSLAIAITAPLRVWNAHRNELTHVAATQPWVRAAARVLIHAPPSFRFDSTVDQSIKMLVAAGQPKTVWRFHRDTEFALIPQLPIRDDLPEIDCALLFGEGGRYSGLLLTAAVKAWGMRHAQQFFLNLVGTRRFKRMVKAVCDANCAGADMAKLPTVIALGWKERHLDSMLGRFMHKDIETVIAWLAQEGFALGFPARNATWPSLVDHADRWEVINRLREDAQAVPSAWRASIPVWRAGAVKFTAIENRSALRVEGAQMHHCAAQYFRQCALGTSAIYRIEGTLPNGKPVRATVEFVKMPAGKGWLIAQIKGRKNFEVHDSLQHMAARLAHELGGPVLIRN